MYVRKITAKSLGINKVGGHAKIAGYLRSVSFTKSTFGDSPKFVGEFAAEVDDKIVESSVLYVPKVAEEFLLAGFEQGSTFSFVIELSTEADISSKVGYTYAMRNVRESTGGAALKLLNE